MECFLEIAEMFIRTTSVDGWATAWNWRGNWYSWQGSDFKMVNQSVIERQILHFLRSRSSRKLRRSIILNIVDMLRLIQALSTEKLPIWLDKNGHTVAEDVFVFKNGTLNVAEEVSERAILQPNRPNLFGIAAVDYSFRPHDGCKLWLQFLDELWPNDVRSKDLLREWFGYCLLPDTSQQKILAITGPPRSGKSTVARVLRQLVGHSNVACPSIRSLSGRFGLWGLLDKKVAIIPDATLPRPCPAVEELLKSISGEDAVDIDRKGAAPLSGICLPTRLVILANEMPAFADPSGALEKRLIHLRTDRSFYGAEDPLLTKKLKDELPGIFNWSIEGLKSLSERGHFPVDEPSLTTVITSNAARSRQVRRIVFEYE